MVPANPHGQTLGRGEQRDEEEIGSQELGRADKGLAREWQLAHGILHPTSGKPDGIGHRVWSTVAAAMRLLLQKGDKIEGT